MNKNPLPNRIAFTILRITIGASLLISTIEIITLVYYQFFYKAAFGQIKLGIPIEIVGLKFLIYFLMMTVNLGLLQQKKWAYIFEIVIDIVGFVAVFISLLLYPERPFNTGNVIALIFAFLLLFINFPNFFPSARHRLK